MALKSNEPFADDTLEIEVGMALGIRSAGLVTIIVPLRTAKGVPVIPVDVMVLDIAVVGEMTVLMLVLEAAVLEIILVGAKLLLLAIAEAKAPFKNS